MGKQEKDTDKQNLHYKEELSWLYDLQKYG